MEYVIYNRLESDAQFDKEPMFWSNEDGWGDLESATKFSKEEVETTAYLPGLESVWMTISEARNVVRQCQID